MKAETENKNWIFTNQSQYSNRTNVYDNPNDKLFVIEHYLNNEKQRKELDELIVTSVNACKEINPDNPLNVAKVLPKMLYLIRNYMNYFEAMNEEKRELQGNTSETIGLYHSFQEFKNIYDQATNK